MKRKEIALMFENDLVKLGPLAPGNMPMFPFNGIRTVGSQAYEFEVVGYANNLHSMYILILLQRVVGEELQRNYYFFNDKSGSEHTFDEIYPVTWANPLQKFMEIVRECMS